MHIVFVAPECAPRVKTGGLGEVLGALPAAIAGLGHRVTVYVPLYRSLRLDMEEQGAAPVVLESLTLPGPGSNRFARVLDGGTDRDVQFYLVDCPELFDREGVYGPPGENYLDNAVRFGLYCRAVLEAVKQLGVPDVLHLHDWQAAFAAIYLATSYAADPMLGRVATVYTIHNGGYQGLFPPEQLTDLLLPLSLFSSGVLRADKQVNPFAGAVRSSDLVTTVSPGYAEELKTPEFGEGLEEVYCQRGRDFVGILNGIDEEEWDPATDPHLAAHYSIEDLTGKRECRADLLRAFGADEVADSTAVIGMVSRLAGQKGFDLIAEAMPKLAEMNLVLLIVGRGEPAVEAQFRDLADKYPDRLRVSPDFSEELAHKMQAGADMTLMPSRYEPSGLTQMYSLRYGTVPVVRATGGLRDTVQEWEEGNGFVFEEYTSGALLAAVGRALKEFADRERWRARVQRGMAVRRGWDGPAREYDAEYRRAVEAHAARTNVAKLTEKV
ncbi:glycogen synthase [Terriglobus aquaticus]|uniref:Glycogen synthase n=1 Tax=Terriglobus aquaticus TaxID=940139 RepID=A0ABW9KKI5_9BACT|nr:glycogen/starch synthase [Terriglobus aquaticus]